MSTKSLTEQIYSYLRNGILAGQFEKDRLPTEKELSEQFFVSRITARNALAQLAREGRIIRIRGKGSYVKHNAPSSSCLPDAANSKMIALVMGGYTPSFGISILQGALHQAQELGYVLIVANTENNQTKEARIINQLLQAGVAGIMVQPVHGESYSKEIVSAVYSGYPLVMVDRSLSGIRTPFVGVDNRKATKKAMDLLLDLGHKYVTLLTLTDEKSSTIEDRMQGFLDAFESRGMLPAKDLWLTQMESRLEKREVNSLPSFRQYVMQIYQHLLDHQQITAVFGTEYTVTLAAIEALKMMGKDVSSKTSVVSFDMNREQLPGVPMICVVQPQFEMGVAAVNMLHASITKSKTALQEIILPTETALYSPNKNDINDIKFTQI